MAFVTLAATQMACSRDLDDNIHKAEKQVTAAAEAGAAEPLRRHEKVSPMTARRISFGSMPVN